MANNLPTITREQREALATVLEYLSEECESGGRDRHWPRAAARRASRPRRARRRLTPGPSGGCVERAKAEEEQEKGRLALSNEQGRSKLAKWWQDAKEAAAPQLAAQRVLAYVKENGEAHLDDLRELLTDEGIAPALHLHVLASMVDAGTLVEVDDAEGGLSYHASRTALSLSLGGASGSGRFPCRALPRSARQARGGRCLGGPGRGAGTGGRSRCRAAGTAREAKRHR